MESTEAQFLRKIDCQLPYEDSETVEHLMDEALSISDNAIFAVLHEICRAPRDRTTAEEQLKLADIWVSKSTHPISIEIYEVAKTMILGGELSVDESIIILDKVSKFSSLWSASHIVYFSCDDVDGKMETHYKKIVKSLGLHDC